MFISWCTLFWIKCWHDVGSMHKEPNLSKVHRLPSQVKRSLFPPWVNKLKSVNRDVWIPAWRQTWKDKSCRYRTRLSCTGKSISLHPVTHFQSGWSGSIRVCPKECSGGNEVIVTAWVEKIKEMLFCLCPWLIPQLALRNYCWEWLHWDTFWSSFWTPTLLEVWCSYKSSYTRPF